MPLLLPAIALVFYLFLTPYYLYHSGQLHYFLYAFHQADPAFLARDWLVTQTANPHPFFASFIAVLKSSGNLPWTLFLIHVLQYFLMLAGIVNLARAISRNPRVPILVLVLFLFYFSDGLGQETLYSAMVQPADIGKLFYLFSLAALFRRQILRMWVFLGLTGLFDFLSGVEGFLILLTMSVIARRPSGRRSNLKHGIASPATELWRARNDVFRMAAGFFLFLICFSPSLVSLLKHFSFSGTFGDREIWKVLFNFRGPHHYRIPTFEAAHIFRVLFPLFFLFAPETSIEKMEKLGKARFYAAILLFFCLLAVASIEWVCFPALTQLRFLRLSPFLAVLGLILLSIRIIQAAGHWGQASLPAQKPEKSNPAPLCWAGTTLAVLFLERDSRLFIPLSLFLIFMWNVFPCHSDEPMSKRDYFARRPFDGGLAMTVWTALLFLVPAGLYLARGRGGEFALDFFLGFSLLFLLKIKTERQEIRVFQMVFCFFLPAFFLRAAFPARVPVHALEIAPEPPLLRENPLYKETLDWVRARTAKDALLLSPPYLDGVRFFGERAIVVDFHANPYGLAEVREWKERLETVTQTHSLETWDPHGGNTEPQREALRKGYLGLSAEKVEEIAARYGADYFLTESEYAGTEALLERGYKLVFKNSAYFIFELQSPS